MCKSELKKAIVDKVESILGNTQDVEKLHIGIFANADEVPTIRYSIEERIDPYNYRIEVKEQG